MKSNGYNLTQLLEIHSNQTDIPASKFFENMQSKGYIPTDKASLQKALETQSGSQTISIKKLNDYHKQIVKDEKKDSSTAGSSYKGLNSNVKSQIKIISDHLIKNNKTIADLHKDLDANNDGSVDKSEFVEGIYNMFQNINLSKQVLSDIFETLDKNGD